MTDTQTDARVRRAYRHIVAAMLLAVTLSALSGNAWAAKFASIVIDAGSGQVLQSTNPDERIYPASLTKMMTLYLLFDAIEAGKVGLDTAFKVSARAARQPPSKLGLKAGETITVRQVIPALIIKSANDVASTVADNLGGGEAEFAVLMRRKARALGMNDTVFRNSSGLPHSQQTTTVRDLARLAQALIRDHQKYYRYFKATSFDWRGETIETHNALVASFPGADGLKTGFISASGFNVATSAVRDGRRLIGVIVGGASPDARDSLMADLLNATFEQSGSVMVAEAVPPVPKPAPAALVEARTMVATVAAAEDEPDDPPSFDRAQGDAADNEAAITADVPGWAVQVGAFSSRAAARTLAEKASSLVPASLAPNPSTLVTPLQLSNGKTLYRARVGGLSQDEARQACRVLAAKKLDCLVVSNPGAQRAALDGTAPRRAT